MAGKSIPTPGIKEPAVRKSPSATKPAKSAMDAEKMFRNMKATGNIAKDKATVAKKTGVWPNGATN